LLGRWLVVTCATAAAAAAAAAQPQWAGGQHTFNGWMDWMHDGGGGGGARVARGAAPRIGGVKWCRVDWIRAPTGNCASGFSGVWIQVCSGRRHGQQGGELVGQVASGPVHWAGHPVGSWALRLANLANLGSADAIGSARPARPQPVCARVSTPFDSWTTSHFFQHDPPPSRPPPRPPPSRLQRPPLAARKCERTTASSSLAQSSQGVGPVTTHFSLSLP